MIAFYFSEHFFEDTYYISTLLSLDEIFPHTFMKINNYDFFFLGWRTSRDHFINDCNIIKRANPKYLYVLKMPCRNIDIIEKTIHNLSENDHYYNNEELVKYLTY